MPTSLDMKEILRFKEADDNSIGANHHLSIALIVCDFDSELGAVGARNDKTLAIKEPTLVSLDGGTNEESAKATSK